MTNAELRTLKELLEGVVLHWEVDPKSAPKVITAYTTSLIALMMVEDRLDRAAKSAAADSDSAQQAGRDAPIAPSEAERKQLRP